MRGRPVVKEYVPARSVISPTPPYEYTLRILWFSRRYACRVQRHLIVLVVTKKFVFIFDMWMDIWAVNNYLYENNINIYICFHIMGHMCQNRVLIYFAVAHIGHVMRCSGPETLLPPCSCFHGLDFKFKSPYLISLHVD